MWLIGFAFDGCAAWSGLLRRGSQWLITQEGAQCRVATIEAAGGQSSRMESGKSTFPLGTPSLDSPMDVHLEIPEELARQLASQQSYILSDACWLAPGARRRWIRVRVGVPPL
jgi:hypothetical protein